MPGATGPTPANGSARHCCSRQPATAAGVIAPSWTRRWRATSGSSPSTCWPTTARSPTTACTRAAHASTTSRGSPASCSVRATSTTAVRIIDRYYELGGDHFLAFDLGPILRRAGRGPRGRPPGCGTTSPGTPAPSSTTATTCPPHEVNYEQSMVAPLLELLIAAHRKRPSPSIAVELTRRLPWLTAFAADQPDVRLRHVPIRHWDGYWFGLLRLWGDVFPHYWSVLSAAVYLTWPPDCCRRPSCHPARGCRPRDPARQPGQLPPRRLGDLRVRLPERRRRPPGPRRRPAGQRPGLGPRLRPAPELTGPGHANPASIRLPLSSPRAAEGARSPDGAAGAIHDLARPSVQALAERLGVEQERGEFDRCLRAPVEGLHRGVLVGDRYGRAVVDGVADDRDLLAKVAQPGRHG